MTTFNVRFADEYLNYSKMMRNIQIFIKFCNVFLCSEKKGNNPHSGDQSKMSNISLFVSSDITLYVLYNLISHIKLHPGGNHYDHINCSHTKWHFIDYCVECRLPGAGRRSNNIYIECCSANFRFN